MLRGFRTFATLPAIITILTGASSDWPPLPTKKFVSGRSALKADVVAGSAVFVAEENGVVRGRPIRIAIPQYAYSRDLKKYVIVIQAEEAFNGIRMIGVRDFKGQTYVTLESDLKFLGKKARKSK